MRLAFICGSLEAGMDGVGDYTRLLAQSLSTRNHQVAIIAVNDNHVSNEVVQNNHAGVSKLRLGRKVPWSEKIELSKQFLSFNPEVISLQYVPYAYNNRGIPIGLSGRLRSLAGASPLHIMFHEIWVGFSKNSPFKHRIIGKIQRYIALDLVRTLKPVALHTSNTLYKSLLAGAGIHAQLLPLFSNLRVDCSELPWVYAEMENLGITNLNRNDWMLVGMFGSCYIDFPLENQVQRVMECARRDRLKIAFLGVGGGNVDNTDWENRIRSVAPEALVKHWGQQSAARVSGILQLLDQGLPMTPKHLLGKSGTAAAFHAHRVKMDFCYRSESEENRNLKKINIGKNNLFWPIEKVSEEFEKLNIITPNL